MNTLPRAHVLRKGTYDRSSQSNRCVMVESKPDQALLKEQPSSKEAPSLQLRFPPSDLNFPSSDAGTTADSAGNLTFFEADTIDDINVGSVAVNSIF